ncbi:hypothetical protein ACF0H5_015149 [Mactra antiquata]
MLKDKHQQDPYNYTYCSLTIDRMSTRQHVDWNPKHKETVGLVDLGTGFLENDVAEACEAIVLLAVGLEGYWKVLIGYFSGRSSGICAQVHHQQFLKKNLVKNH